MTAGVARATANPFVTIPLWARVLIIGYLLLYRLFFPAIAHVIAIEASPLDAMRFLTEALYTFLLLAPFLFYRRDFGWLHPLMFPTLYTLLKGFFKSPLQLIAPLDLPLISFSPQTQSYAAVLRNLSAEDLAQDRVYMTLLLCLALMVYYGAFFFGPRFRIPRIAFRTPAPARVQIVCLTVIGGSVLMAIGFIAMQGGLSQHIMLLVRPRFTTIGGLGHVVFIIGTGTIATMVWLAYDPKSYRNLLFWAAVLATTACVIMASGSRSAGVIFFMMLGMVWIMRTSRIPFLTIAVIGLFAFAIFGAVGLIRHDFNAERVNWSAVTSLDYESWIKAAAEEAENRSDQETSLAALVGANRYGLLYGRTYVGALFFWVPRAIWPDKPRTTGSYNSQQNFSGRPLTEDNPTIGGKPVTAEIEAYWNFHIFGVIILFFLIGMLHRWLVNLLLTYPRVPAIWVLYVVTLVTFNGTADSFIGAARSFLFLILLLGFLGLIDFRRTSKSRSTAPASPVDLSPS